MTTPTRTDLTTLLDRNRSFAAQFEGGELKIRPRLMTFILSCIDARVDPAHLFQLEPGDAIVLRTGGGRITPGVMGDLAVLGVLAANLPGGRGASAQLVIIHHNDCGMARLAVPEIQEQLAQRLGVSNEVVAAMAVTDPVATVNRDIEKLRRAPGAPDTLIVSGLVYDVNTGKVDEIVPAGPLRTAS